MNMLEHIQELELVDERMENLNLKKTLVTLKNKLVTLREDNITLRNIIQFLDELVTDAYTPSEDIGSIDYLNDEAIQILSSICKWKNAHKKEDN